MTQFNIFSFARFFNNIKKNSVLRKARGYARTTWVDTFEHDDCYGLYFSAYNDERNHMIWLNQRENTINFLFGLDAEYHTDQQLSTKLKSPNISFDFPMEWSPHTANLVLKPYSELCQVMYMHYEETGGIKLGANEVGVYQDSTVFMIRALELGRVETTEGDLMTVLAEPLTHNIPDTILSTTGMFPIMSIGQFYRENWHQIAPLRLNNITQQLILIRHNILTSNNIPDVRNMYKFVNKFRDRILLEDSATIERTSKQFARDMLPYIEGLIDEINQHQIRLVSSTVVELSDISEEVLERINDDGLPILVLVCAGQTRS